MTMGRPMVAPIRAVTSMACSEYMCKSEREREPLIGMSEGARLGSHHSLRRDVEAGRVSMRACTVHMLHMLEGERAAAALMARHLTLTPHTSHGRTATASCTVLIYRRRVSQCRIAAARLAMGRPALPHTRVSSHQASVSDADDDEELVLGPSRHLNFFFDRVDERCSRLITRAHRPTHATTAPPQATHTSPRRPSSPCARLLPSHTSHSAF